MTRAETGFSLEVIHSARTRRRPEVLGVLVAGITGWLGIVTGVRGFMQWRRARKEEHNLREVYERPDGNSR